MISVSLLLACFFQDPSPEAIRALVEQLGVDSPAERAQAERALEDAGLPAIPELEKAAESSDAEVAARAARLIRIIPVAAKVTRNVRRAVTDAVDRLLAGGKSEWTDVFLEAAALDEGKPRHAFIGPDDLTPLVDPALRGCRETPEEELVCALVGVWKVRRAAPVLAKLLPWTSPRVRMRSIETLRALGAAEAIPQVRDFLTDLDSGVRHQAAAMLVQLGGKEGRAAVAKMLQEADLTFQWTAVEAIKVLPPTESVPLFVLALRDPACAVRPEITARLAEVAGKESIPALTALLADDAAAVRVAAARGLFELEARGSTAAVTRLLEDPQAAVRELAVFMLGEWKVKEAAPGVVKLLGDLSHAIRRGGVVALGQMGARDAAPAIVELLSDPDDRVRWSVVEALASMEAREAAPAVRRRLDSGRAEVRAAAATALARLKDVEGAPLVAGLLKDGEAEVRTAAAEALGDLGARDPIPALSRALADPEAQVALQALLALEKLGARSEAARIAGLLEAPREELWEDAVRILGVLGSPEQVPVLVKLLGRQEEGLLRRALLSLEALDARSAVPDLLKLLEHSSRTVRIEAAFALASLGSGKGAPVLLANELRLIGLNGVRNPEAWKKLRRSAPGAASLEAEAGKLGLSVEWDPALNEAERRQLAQQYAELTGSCVAWGLEIGIAQQGYGVILEKDRIRILRQEDAVRHWRKAFGLASEPGRTVVEK